MTTRHNVTLYTDGSCSGNPGPGGWAAILVMTKANGQLHSKELSGPLARTTNNYAELLAVQSGIRALTSPCAINVVTDSNCVISWVTKGAGKDTPDHIRYLIKELVHAIHLGGHVVKCEKIPGHSGHIYNERCDELAKAATELAKDEADADRDIARDGDYEKLIEQEEKWFTEGRSLL